MTLTAAERALIRAAVRIAERRGERLKTAWWVLTGAPGSGKTTLLNRLRAMHWPTVEDAGRAELAGEPPATNPRGSPAAYLEFQQRVLRRGQAALDALNPAERVVFDYGLAESLAFMKVDGISWPAHFVAAAAAVKFAKVFLIEPLTLANAVPSDRARLHSLEERHALSDLMGALYETLGEAPIRVPAMPVGARLETVLHWDSPSPAVASAIPAERRR